jgi:hypothetical protein
MRPNVDGRGAAGKGRPRGGDAPAPAGVEAASAAGRAPLRAGRYRREEQQRRRQDDDAAGGHPE